MKHMLKAPETWIVALAVFVRGLNAWFLTEVLRTPEQHDALYFHEWASRIARGDGFPPTAHWMPGYPLLLSAFYSLLGPTLGVARGVNVVLGGAATVLVMLWGRPVVGRRASRAGGLLLALSPVSFTWSGYLACENLYVVLILGMAVWWQRECRHSPYAWAFVAGLLGGLATLVRPEAAGIVVLLSAYLVFGRRSASAGQRWSQACLMAGALLLVLAPWAARNHRLFSRWIPLTTSSGVGLLELNVGLAQGYGPYRSGVPGDNPRGWNGAAEYLEMPGAGELELMDRAREVALKWIAAHPQQFVQGLLLKAREAWHISDVPLFRDQLATSGSRSMALIERWFPAAYMALFMVAGWVGLAYSRGRSGMEVFWIVLAVTQASMLAFYPLTRYRLALLGLWVPFAGFALTQAAYILKTRHRRAGSWWARFVAVVLMTGLAATRWVDTLLEFVPRLRA